MIDINFGADKSPGLSTNKVGIAATGETASDFWNFYSRDDANGNYLVNGALPNLKYVDGAVSQAGLIVNNAPGAWYNGSSDPMYNTFLYPLGGGNITVVVTNLAPGQYDFYIYSQDGNYQLSAGGTDYGVKTTYDQPILNPTVWQEGRQYALFHGVPIAAGQSVTIIVRPGQKGYPVISGMQIATAAETGTGPVIAVQPQDLTVSVGGSATFGVTASGTAPLSYQWRFNGNDLSGATGSSLTIANVQMSNAGPYSVWVTNEAGSVLSSNAILTVAEAESNGLIDINFGADKSPGLSTNKVGIAATGESANDFWNFYSRDDANGNYLVNGALPNLKYVDGVASSAGLTVSNAPGAWYNGATDPMYNTYLYPLKGGNITVVVTNVVPGQYDFYVYGHDGNYQLSAGGTDYGVKTTYDQPILNPTVWQEGRQYALFHSVSIAAGQFVTIIVRPGQRGYPVISGMQIAAAAETGTGPVIGAQPQDQTVSVGDNVTFSVTATGSAPLSYQWRFNGNDLSGATSSSLTIANVQTSDAGPYAVWVTNETGSVLSSNAILTVAEVESNGLIDINFGADKSPGLSTNKVGIAATGESANDFWNFYSRDDANGNYLVNGALPDLKYADGVVSSAGLTVSNAPGAWYNGATDPMYNTYLYPLEGGNITVVVTNLASGQYDFYVYGHDGNYQLSAGGTDYGVKTTYDQPILNPTVWQEGRQYALYQSVAVSAGQSVTIIVRPGQRGYPVISGMQVASALLTGIGPVIEAQPQHQTVSMGGTATFSVTASGTAPLSYQWRFNGNDLSGATGPSLTIANVQMSNAGPYSVWVTNKAGSALSSNAILTVVEVEGNGLIDINFGADKSPGLSTNKVGMAAVGESESDFWNFYSRDDANGNYLVNGALPNLKYVDGVVSSAGVAVSNAPGSWYNGATDPMYNTYLYPLEGGNITVVVTNLASGQYDFYVYGHDGNYQLSAGGTDYGVKTTYDQPILNPTVWQEGRQYALYQSIAVSAGESVTIIVRPGQRSYPVISGMQIQKQVRNLAAKFAVSPLALFTGVTNLVVIAADCTAAAQVVLDASDSTGGGSGTLSCTWFDGKELMTTGMLTTNRLAIGSHDITLVVADGVASATQTKTVEVISLPEAVGVIISQLEDANLSGQISQPLMTSLKAAADSFSRCNLKVGLTHLETFQKRVDTRIAPIQPALAAELTVSIEVIANALETRTP